MSTIDVVVLPTLYISALVSGFLLNTCSKRKELAKLEEERDDLENDVQILHCRLSQLSKQLEQAKNALNTIITQASNVTQS